MAVGIACGSTGMQAALSLLDPLLADSVDFVRQGALIATSLVLMQQPETKVRIILNLLPCFPAAQRQPQAPLSHHGAHEYL